MDDRQYRIDQPEVSTARFQFSLRTLLVLTAAVAVVCSGLFAGPPLTRFLTVACFALSWPAVLTVALIYGRGYFRTFCIAALFPAGVFLIYQMFLGVSFISVILEPSLIDEFPLETLLLLVVPIGFSIAVGLLGVLTRWVIEAPRREQRKRNLPAPASQPAQRVSDS